ncbi:MAG: LysR family transcriptional regulator [Chloroflexi bacterium]|nr:LysR family transcriptional regulator [Chloroflexota bacterium]
MLEPTFNLQPSTPWSGGRMYLEQFRSFCAVVDHGSYTRAARQLHLTQPAVSQHVRSLELAFGLPLLERLGGRVQPTEAGALVYRHGVDILVQVDALRGELAALRGLSGGQVVLGAGPAPGNYVLPQVVARFRRRHPGLRVELRVDTAPRIFEQVLRGTVDFAVVVGVQMPHGLATEPLYRDPLVLVVAPEHPILRRWPRAMPRAALASLPLVVLSQETTVTRRLCDEWLREAGIEPRIEMEFESMEPIKRVVANGMGAGFVFYSSVALEVAAGRLKVLDVAGPPLFGQFVLARRVRQHLAPAAQAFLQALVADLQTDGLVEAVNLQAVERFLASGSQS